MPSETFFRLPEEKRNKILKAIRKEFAEEEYEQISINRIIREADIPRGSFYQYFVDKKDLFAYLVTECQKEMAQFAKEKLVQSQGDPFDFALNLFDEMTRIKQGESQKHRLYANLLGNLRMQDRAFLQEFRELGCRDVLEVKSLIDTGRLRARDQKELDEILDIIYILLMHTLGRLFEENCSIEKVREELVAQFEWIKLGVAQGKE